MKKKILIVASAALGVVLLALFLVVPALASDGDTPKNEESWQQMHEACENGNWQAMNDAMQKVYGGTPPCHNQDDETSPTPGQTNTFGRGGMMGGGMMGGGMMGWR